MHEEDNNDKDYDIKSETKIKELRKNFRKIISDDYKTFDLKEFISNKEKEDQQEINTKCKILTINKSDLLKKNMQNEKNGFDFKKFLEDELVFNMLPDDIYISTMTVTCKIGDIKFNCENIARYIDLSYDDIEDIICAYEDLRKNKTEKKIIFRSLPYIKNKKKKNENKDVFYNQVSIHSKIKTRANSVHIKLFKNGSIHITGCQTGNDIYEILNIMITKMKAEKFIIDADNKIVEKPFVTDKSKLDIGFIENLKVNMINTNYVLKDFQINLEKLYNLLLLKKIECRYDKLSHACVNVKYNHPEKKVSIFVFEKGSIVITGAKNGEHIRLAYDFINKILLSNYRTIVKKTVNIKEMKEYNDSLHKNVDIFIKNL